MSLYILTTNQGQFTEEADGPLDALGAFYSQYPYGQVPNVTGVELQSATTTAIELPAVTYNSRGWPRWIVDTDTFFPAEVTILPDGEIATYGAASRIDDPDRAEALGRALIAAARHSRKS